MQNSCLSKGNRCETPLILKAFKRLEIIRSKAFLIWVHYGAQRQGDGLVCVWCVLRAVVQCDEKLTISASWSKDEDISRLLQSLPNWANMTQPRQTRQKREDEEDFTRYVRVNKPALTTRFLAHVRKNQNTN